MAGPDINQAIGLPEELPEAYPANLATLPERAREAIQEDRRRYALARGWITGMTRAQIETRLGQIKAEHANADMRRRLNQVIARKRTAGKQPEGRTRQAGLDFTNQKRNQP